MACGKIFKASNKNFKLKNNGMDIRELRIGDKVKYLAKIFTIRMLCEDGYADLIIPYKSHSEIEYGVDIKDIKPIPLSDELLKKIGFTPMGDSRFALTDAALHKYDAINYMFVTRYTHKLIKYLHQLQHELYDAGIELKIELQ